MQGSTDDRGYNQIWPPSAATELRATRRINYIIETAQIDSAKNVLEIGCGIGKTAWEIVQATSATITAIDCCENFIERAKLDYSHPKLTYLCGDFLTSEFPKKKSFDVILGNGILHHLYPSLDQALYRIFNLLSKNGRIVFLEPNIFNPYVYLIFTFPKFRKWAKLDPEEMAFSPRFIKAQLLEARFSDIVVEFKDFLLPGIPDILIEPSMVIGEYLESWMVTKIFSQSIFISASRPGLS